MSAPDSTRGCWKGFMAWDGGSFWGRLHGARQGFAVLTADVGSQSEANLQQVAQQRISTLIADQQIRRQDEPLGTQARHQAVSRQLHDKTRVSRAVHEFAPDQFVNEANTYPCVCRT